MPNEELKIGYTGRSVWGPGYGVPLRYRRKGSHNLWWRWNLLWIFIIGYLATISKFDRHSAGYAFANAISIFACMFLLLQLRTCIARNIAVWLTLVLFLTCYYLKFYWIVIDPSIAQGALPPITWASFSSEEILFHGFGLVTAAFCGFCLITGACLSLHRRPYYQHFRYDELPRSAHAFISNLLLCLLPPLMLGFGYFAFLFNIGELGINSAPLPFKLAGMIFYSRLIFIPALLLLQISSARKAGQQIKCRIGLFLFLAHGMSDVVLRSTREGVLLVLLMLLLLERIHGFKPTKGERAVLLISLLLAIAVLPLITEYRWLRLSGVGVTSTIPLLLEGTSNTLHMFQTGSLFLLARIPGVEVFLSVIALAKPLDLRAFHIIASRDIANYLTVDVYGFAPGLPHSNAPGFLGWFFLVGGGFAVVLSALMLGGFVSAAWDKIQNLRLYSLSIAQTLLLTLVFNLLTEGTLEKSILQFCVVIFTIGTCEILLAFSDTLSHRLLL